ncbi:MAG: methyl-accepting chemotaxis protein [Moorellaceae bacterium]
MKGQLASKLVLTRSMKLMSKMRGSKIMPSIATGRGFLEQFIAIAPFLNTLLSGDVAVTICDRQRYLLYVPGKEIDHRVKAGDPVREGSLVWEAMQKGRLVKRRVAKEIFGFPYLGIAIPVEEDGEIVGAVSILENIDRQETFAQMAGRLNLMAQEASAAVEEIYAEAENLAEIGKTLHEIAAITTEKASVGSEIVEFISKIAYRSKILGLNASIEAARISKEGAGFAVVAREVHSMAENTSEAGERISKALEELRMAISSLKERAERIRDASSAQAQALSKIAEIVQQINGLALYLHEEAAKFEG